MELKTAEWHYNETKPRSWSVYSVTSDDITSQTESIVQSVRHEIAEILREALNSAETSLPQLIEDVHELAQAGKRKPAEVAVETEDERRGRMERERFWGGESHVPWASMLSTEKVRWIAYAATINRPKVSPGQRLFEAMNKAYGWGIFWCDCTKRQELEDAAKELGIKECDA